MEGRRPDWLVMVSVDGGSCVFRAARIVHALRCTWLRHNEAVLRLDTEHCRKVLGHCGIAGQA